MPAPIVFQQYIVGDVATDIISCSVRVGTVANAQTTINLAQPNGSISNVGHSPSFNGNVDPVPLGAAPHMKGCLLSFLTEVNLSAFDQQQREALIENMSIEYAVQGGYEGRKIYAPTSITPSTNGLIYQYSTFVQLV